MSNVMRKVRQLLCSLRPHGGHDYHYTFEDGHTRLRCADCAHTTSGWRLPC